MASTYGDKVLQGAEVAQSSDHGGQFSEGSVEEVMGMAGRIEEGDGNVGVLTVGE
jgi:hypothetical protein